MKITSHDVKVYQRIHRIHKGTSISKDDAYKRLQKLVKQVELIYNPVSLEEIKALNIEIVTDEPRTERNF